MKNPSYGFKNGLIRSGTESVPLIAGFSTAIDLLNEYIEVKDCLLYTSDAADE